MEMPEGLSEQGRWTFSQMESEGGQRMAADLDRALTATKKRTIKEKKATAADLKRAAILEALVQAGSITEAAEMAGISRKTLYNYLNNDEEFVIAYRDIKRAQLRETAGKVQAAADKATDFITGLLDDKEAPYPVRLNAALKLLDLAGVYRDIEAQINENTIKDAGGILQISHASAV